MFSGFHQARTGEHRWVESPDPDLNFLLFSLPPRVFCVFPEKDLLPLARGTALRRCVGRAKREKTKPHVSPG